MKKNKSAQAAMEFLMTYGWAILVMLAAVGALAYFGVFDPERFVPKTPCYCDGCKVGHMNEDDIPGGDDKIIISCCYSTYIDNASQCHRLRQIVEFNVTDYRDTYG